MSIFCSKKYKSNIKTNRNGPSPRCNGPTVERVKDTGVREAVGYRDAPALNEVLTNKEREKLRTACVEIKKELEIARNNL